VRAPALLRLRRQAGAMRRLRDETQRVSVIAAWLLLIAVTYGPRTASAVRTAAFDDLLAKRTKAVTAVAQALTRALAPGVVCSAGDGCSGGRCAPHMCGSGPGMGLRCSHVLGNALRDEATCGANSVDDGFLLNENRSFLWTPVGEAVVGKDGVVDVVDVDLKREVCAVRGMEDVVLNAWEENGLKFWLYAGTAKGALTITPGRADGRESGNEGKGTAGFKSCGYDPRQRPWYVTASSGPKDVVFLYDASLSGGDAVLRDALQATVSALDTRDFVAVVAFDGGGAQVLGMADGEEKLESGTNDVKKRLSTALDGLAGGSGDPDVTAAFEKAFDLLVGAAADGAATSGCKRLIVLLSGRADKCFRDCTGSNAFAECRCVEELRAYVAGRQSALGDSPATVVSFTDGGGNDAERMARTVTCDEVGSGIWRGVSKGESPSKAMSSYSQITAATLFDINPKVFSSEVYEDSGGLGGVFTLALPVYSRDERRLLGVAAADITVHEVSDAVGGEEQALEQITELSRESRDCATTVRSLDSCELQVLRSQPGSGMCADILARFELPCYRFGETVYTRGGVGQHLNWEDALAKCESLGSGARLALVDTSTKNAFVSGIVDADGSWVGLRSKLKGPGWRWTTGEGVADNATQWSQGLDGAEAAGGVHNKFNGPACASVDRRGVSGNWNALPCEAKRAFVCEMPADSEAASTSCTRGIFVYQETKYTPVHSLDCSNFTAGTACSEDEDNFVRKAEPFCADRGGEDFTNFDRFCCGGRADVLREKGSGDKGNGMGTAGIVGIAVSSVVLFAILTTLLFCYCWRRRAAKDDKCGGSSPSSDVLGAASTLPFHSSEVQDTGILRPAPVVAALPRFNPAAASGSTVSGEERQYSFDDPVDSIQDSSAHGQSRNFGASHASGSGEEDNYGYG
jgi:Lectin C-type domain